MTYRMVGILYITLRGWERTVSQPDRRISCLSRMTQHWRQGNCFVFTYSLWRPLWTNPTYNPFHTPHTLPLLIQSCIQHLATKGCSITPHTMSLLHVPSTCKVSLRPQALHNNLGCCWSVPEYLACRMSHPFVEEYEDILHASPPHVFVPDYARLGVTKCCSALARMYRQASEEQE